MPSVRGSSHTSVHIPALDQAWSLLLCYHEKELGFFSVEAQKPLEKEDQNSLQGEIGKVPWRECTKWATKGSVHLFLYLKLFSLKTMSKSKVGTWNMSFATCHPEGTSKWCLVVDTKVCFPTSSYQDCIGLSQQFVYDIPGVLLNTTAPFMTVYLGEDLGAGFFMNSRAIALLVGLVV